MSESLQETAALVEVPGVDPPYSHWSDPVVALRDALWRDSKDVEDHRDAWTVWLRRRGVNTTWLARLSIDALRFGTLTRVEDAYDFRVPMPTVYGDDAVNTPLVLASDGARYWAARKATVVGGWDIVTIPEGACWPALTPRVESVLVSNALDARLLGWTPSFMLLRETVPAKPAPPRRVWQWLTGRMPRLDCAIALVGEHSFQYGHWLLDYLPRLLAVRGLPSGIPVIVDVDVPPNSLWWLRKVLPGRRLIKLERGQSLDVGTLYVPLQRTFCPTGWTDSMEITPDVWVSDASAISQIQKIVTTDSAPRARSRRLFLGRRGGHRSLLNQEELFARAAPLGFEMVYLETLSMPETQRLLDEAREVIAPAGAQLLNVMAAQPGLRLLVMTGYFDAGWRAWNIVNTCAGHHAALVVGTRIGPPGRNRYEDTQRPYMVDADLLESAVHQHFGSSGNSESATRGS